jgi:hypothetical protein
MLTDNSSPGPGGRDRSLTLGILAFGTVLAVVLRLLPYVEGFAWMYHIMAVGALALFAGARLRSWLALVPPLVALAASDAVLWFGKGYSPSWVSYACFGVYVLLGVVLLRQSRSPWRVGGVTLIGALNFFLVTNFAVWLKFCIPVTMMPDGAAWAWMKAPPGLPFDMVLRYSMDLPGLAACYGMALPFAWRTLLGDAVFTALFFGVHALLSRTAARPRIPVPVPSHQRGETS